jgi:hypothetical protein
MQQQLVDDLEAAWKPRQLQRRGSSTHACGIGGIASKLDFRAARMVVYMQAGRLGWRQGAAC